MKLQHLNSDLRQYFWSCAICAPLFIHLTFKMQGASTWFFAYIALADILCAVAIYRLWRSTPWIYLAGTLGMLSWGIYRIATSGYSHSSLGIIIGSLLMITGFHWIKVALIETHLSEIMEETDLFELPEEKKSHVDSLVKSYEGTIGKGLWEHFLVPRTLWIHRYADYIITIPPDENRNTWLYGTMLISTLTGERMELILERPERDTEGAIHTLCSLTEYIQDYSLLEEWHTMGLEPFYGEDSAVRGLLFCKPPQHLASSIPHPQGEIKLLYVAGITEEQLNNAQEQDTRNNDWSGAKALYEELGIAHLGISRLPN